MAVAEVGSSWLRVYTLAHMGCEGTSYRPARARPTSLGAADQAPAVALVKLAVAHQAKGAVADAVRAVVAGEGSGGGRVGVKKDEKEE